MDNSIRHFNIGLKSIAIILVLAIFATLLPTRIVVFAEMPDVPDASSGSMVSLDGESLPSDDQNYTVDALYEDISLRTLSSKTLRQNDGTFKTGSYSFNVHFETDDGFMEYDNTLVHKDGKYSPAVSDRKIAFFDDRLEYSVISGDTDVTFSLLGDGQNEPTVEIGELPKRDYSSKAAELFSVPNAKSQIIYRNIYDGVSFEYVLFGSNIKENIILETVPESLSFKFRLSTGCEVYIDDEGTVHIGDGMIPHAFMEDGAGTLSTDVEYILEQDEDGYVLSIVPDRDWLEAEERVFPVRIDPTFRTENPSTSNMKDAYVKEGNREYNSTYDSFLHVGFDADDYLWLHERIFIKLVNLPVIPKASRILNAYISLEQSANYQWYSYEPTTLSSIIVTAKPVTSSWDDTTITWANAPGFGNEIIDYSVASLATAERMLSFDITSCVQAWYAGTVQNNGIVLQTADESVFGHLSFTSVNDNNYSDTNPVYEITYYDTKGLESRWAYASEDAGTAGTVYVNLYNGKPVLTGPGLSTQDGILPYSVYPVYNGYLSGLQFVPSATDKNAPVTASFNATAGYGFKLSSWESLTSKNINGTIYVCYNDADGTELYFRNYPGVGYFSEDGYDMEVTYLLNDPYFVMISDSKGNRKYFNSAGRITQILDEYNNQKAFVYDSLNRLSEIRFKSASMSSAETQLTFSYNTGNAIKRITNAKDTSVYIDFYYSSTQNGNVSQDYTGYLRKIRYSNGDFAEYQYDAEGNLCFMRQGSGTTYGDFVQVTLGSDGRVSELCEYSSDVCQGNKCTFQYGHKKTTVRTAGADDIFGNGDDLLSVYLFDNYGNTVCSYLTDIADEGKETVYGASSSEYTEYNVSSNPKANNSVVKTGGKGKYSKNLVTNGNLDSAFGWTQSLSYVSCAASSTERFFGTGSVYLSGSTSICSGTLSQSVTIPEAGTYTFSAYVKSNMTMGYQYTGIINGAYIALDGTKSDIISTALDTNVQNGWRKLSVTKTFQTAGTYTVELALRNMFGPVYFDGATLIKGDTAAAEFNYLINAWVHLGTVTIDNDNVVLSCDPGGSSSAYAFVDVNKPASSAAYVLSGWSKGCAVPENDTSDYPSSMTDTHKERFWGLTAVINYSDSTSETQKVHFNPAVSNEWQYASSVIIPSEENLNKTISTVVVYLSYSDNANSASFKDICFTETDAAAYEYDSNGNVIKARNTETSSTLTYSGTDLANVTDSTGNGISYTYVSNQHKILTATDSQGITATYGYNTNGLANSAVITPSSGSGQISSSAVYDNYGDLISETDTLGHTTSYGYNTGRGLLNYIENANSHRTQYVYDLGGKLTGVFADNDKDGMQDSGESGVSYTYNAKNYLTEIFNGATTYHFSYDNYGNVTSVTIGSNTVPLVSYTYASFNGKLLSSTYADGTVISNTYDKLSRISAVSYNGIVAYTVTYDGEGNVSSYTDCATGRVYRYEYDAMGREVRFFVTLNGTELYAAEKSYDSNGRSAGYRYTIGSVGSRTGTNTYDQYSRLSQETTSGGDTVSYTYDGFGRVVTKTTGSYSEHYEYVTSGNNTSTLVSKKTQKYGGTTIKTIEYTYDNIGNILTEDDGVTFRQYTYDSLNQLASETYYDKTTFNGEARFYFNSENGNISYTRFAIITGKYYNVGWSGHGYGNGTDWKELLTSFGGTPITYDANGNPLSYYNGQSYTFTWQKGRQLAGASTNNTSVTFGYDVTGKRISKTVGSTVHEYTYDGSLLLCDKWGSEYIEYFYDASGSPYALSYFDGLATTKYYFVKNIEGDILELRSSTDTLVARYIYDGWGKLLGVRDASGNAITSSTHIANLNILRYRGYVYDTETKLYYLLSRYYDPQVQRFINSDRIEVLGVGGDILGYNGFAYCENNPVNRADHDGNFWHILAGAVLGAIGGAVSSIVSQVVSGQDINWKAVAFSTASGAVGGAITAACPCMAPAAAALVQGTLSVATYCVTEVVAYGRAPDPATAIEVGVTSGMISYGIQAAGRELGLIQCFIAGTIVATKDGAKKIEDIQIGDYVWATDPETGETGLREVKQLFRNETDEWIHITVNDEEIVCTPNHPFWVPVKGWTKACHLRAGDRLQLLNGEYVVVEQIQHELLEHPETTYNFEVEGYHTYYVGDCGILVHNLGCNNPEHGNSLTTSKPAKGYVLRDVDTHEILKYGETTRGLSRYSNTYLSKNNAYMDFVTEGTKAEMHLWQQEMIENYVYITGQLPPLNRSFW